MTPFDSSTATLFSTGDKAFYGILPRPPYVCSPSNVFGGLLSTKMCCWGLAFKS